MARAPNLPLLPGYSFNPNIGRTNFRIDPKFDFNAGVPCLVEKVRPNLFGALGDRYPSFYARGETIELPGWITFDKHILTFEAFFQQTLQEVPNAPYIVRNVKIYFYLEDGTVQVMEKKQDNSGLEQGTLISRQRIRMPAPMDDNFFDVLDFNVGREVELFGKVFKITNCDKFTRNFLNRNGVAVPDPIPPPLDPFLTHRSTLRTQMFPKHPNTKVDTFGKFMKYDKMILRFYGYWDDRETEFGEFHDLEIFYYLADDTIEIKDLIPPNGGRDTHGLFMKRTKLPKQFAGLPAPGVDSPFTVLNVLGQGINGFRYVVDPLNCGKDKVEYYQENDLSIGGILNCFGRKVVLTDCDGKTKEYYRAKYGIDSFVAVAKPNIDTSISNPISERELPPWNGYGTFEDSAQNCTTVELKPPLRDFKKFLQYDRHGMDSHILRYQARMVSKIKENCGRIFLICYFLTDDTIQVVELPRNNSGFQSNKSIFFSRMEIFKPGQEMYQSKKPEIYKAEDLYIGAQIIINSFHFILIDADEYALRYTELHPHEFPRSDIDTIMSKLREKLRPIYKDFVGEMIPEETVAMPYSVLRNKLCPIMGDDFTEHEMITIARAFSANCQDSPFTRDAIRAITLTELKRQLWDDLDRLKEYFWLRDPERTGQLSRQDIYTLIKGCRIPIDQELIERIFTVIMRDENDMYCYNDLFDFLDRKKCPLTDTIPINVKSELWWASEKPLEAGRLINWCEFNKALDLETLFDEVITPELVKEKEMKDREKAEALEAQQMQDLVAELQQPVPQEQQDDNIGEKADTQEIEQKEPLQNDEQTGQVKLNGL